MRRVAGILAQAYDKVVPETATLNPEVLKKKS